MNKKVVDKIQYYLEDFSRLNEISRKTLLDWEDQMPYYQPLKVLLAKKNEMLGSGSSDDRLKAAVYFNNHFDFSKPTITVNTPSIDAPDTKVVEHELASDTLEELISDEIMELDLSNIGGRDRYTEQDLNESVLSEEEREKISHGVVGILSAQDEDHENEEPQHFIDEDQDSLIEMASDAMHQIEEEKKEPALNVSETQEEEESIDFPEPAVVDEIKDEEDITPEEEPIMVIFEEVISESEDESITSFDIVTEEQTTDVHEDEVNDIAIDESPDHIEETDEERDTSEEVEAISMDAVDQDEETQNDELDDQDVETLEEEADKIEEGLSQFTMWLNATKQKHKADKKKKKKDKKRDKKKDKKKVKDKAQKSKGKKDKKKKKKDKIIEDANKSNFRDNSIVSETLADILADQGHHSEAKKMYVRLALLFPDKEEHFQDKIKNLKS